MNARTPIVITIATAGATGTRFSSPQPRAFAHNAAPTIDTGSTPSARRLSTVSTRFAGQRLARSIGPGRLGMAASRTANAANSPKNINTSLAMRASTVVRRRAAGGALTESVESVGRTRQRLRSKFGGCLTGPPLERAMERTQLREAEQECGFAD